MKNSNAIYNSSIVETTDIIIILSIFSFCLCSFFVLFFNIYGIMKKIKSFDKYNEDVLTDGFTPENARYNAGIVANKIIVQLKNLLLPVGKLTEQVVTKAINSLNTLNRII